MTLMRHADHAHRAGHIVRGLLAWKKRQALALAGSVALLLVPALQAQKAGPSEYQVKAAYLYNFGRFIEWPNKAGAPNADPFGVCVLGQDPFGQSLDAVLAGETIHGASAVAARISKPKDAVNCRILFISSSEAGQLKQILEALEGTGVLTVSDLPQFSERGGMVQFVLEGKKVRFEVNLTPVEHAHLALSSQLLKVAVNLRRSDRMGD